MCGIQERLNLIQSASKAPAFRSLMRYKWGRNCPNPCYPGLHPSPLCTTTHNHTPPKAGSITEKPGPPDAQRREAKSNGERERYSHLNAEFQRISRRDKRAFLSDQCKEIEENNRMGKTRDLFKKIRDIKGTFQAKVGSIKDRNGRDLTEAEDIKTRWQEYTELYKKRSSQPM